MDWFLIPPLQIPGMGDTRESIRYGFQLYPFALLIVLGLFISGSGTTLLQSVLGGLQSLPFFSVIVLLLTLALQALGAVIAAAGVFGALYRIIQDAK